MARTAQQYGKIREAAIKALGGKCRRCGFKDKRALQIDHVHSDGAEERRREGNRNAELICQRIIDGEQDRYQILCANCNWIKRSEAQELDKKAFRRMRRGIDKAELKYLVRQQVLDANGRPEKGLYGPASPVKVLSPQEISELEARLRGNQA